MGPEEFADFGLGSQVAAIQPLLADPVDLAGAGAFANARQSVADLLGM